MPTYEANTIYLNVICIVNQYILEWVEIYYVEFGL